MSLSKKQKYLIGVAVLVLLALSGITRTAAPKGGGVAIDIRFQSFTTNATGVRMAQFDVQNNSSFPIKRAWFSDIQIETPTGWRTLTNIHLPNPVFGPVVLPGGNEITDMPVPQTASPWRVSLIYFKHQSHLEDFLHEVKEGLRDLGVPVESSARAYGFNSDAVTP